MSLIEEHIATVGTRFRHADWWRYVAALSIGLTCVGLLLFYLQISHRWMHALSGWALLLASVLGCLAISAGLVWKYRDQHWLADRIEESYPELNQRLLTTLGQMEKNAGRPLGFLEHTVLLETVSHAHHNGWFNIISQNVMKRLRSRGLIAFCMMMVVSIGLLKFQPPASAFAANTSSEDGSLTEDIDFEVRVDPGDTEVEYGDNLVVVARFGKSIPRDVELVMTAADGTENRVVMTKSIDDRLFGSTVYDVTKPVQYAVSYNSAATKKYQVGVYTLPELIRADAALDYPSYTAMPPKVIEDTVRVSAVEGTELTWKLFLNKPGVRATLIPQSKDAKPISMSVDPADPAQLTANVDLTMSQSWTLQLVDADGRENRSPPKLVAKVSPNKPPKLKLDLARDARVSPLEEFQVRATASDDFGLQRYGIQYTLASAEREIVLGENASAGQKAIAEYLLDFEALEAQPDQLLSYHFWAEDLGSTGESRRTQSDMFFTEVRHFEEIFRQGEQPADGQQQQQQQGQSQNGQDAEQLAEVQKQIVNATWNTLRQNQSDLQAWKDDVGVILESQQATLEQAATLSGNLQDTESKNYMLVVQERMQDAIGQLTTAFSDASVSSLQDALNAERGALEALLKLRAREHEIVQQQSQQQGQSSQSSSRQRFQQQMEALKLKNDENRYETQRQAEEEEDAAQTEMRRALNQLKELAQRQEDLNQQLKELQTALEKAESTEEREEIERQLKRLRDQQEEMLRDTDELRERLDQAEDQETVREAREQLEQTREQMRDTSESLEQGEVTPALASGTRAQRELEEMREELRRESANQYADQMREMRDEIRSIEEKQAELGAQIERSDNAQDVESGLRNERDGSQQNADALREQREQIAELLERIRNTVTEAEESEPLLAEGLYDAFRDAEKNQLEDRLEATAQMTERGFNEQASALEKEVRQDIGELREQIDVAADRVLGDQADALRRAMQTLKDLENQLNNEMEQFGENASANQPSPNRGDTEQQPSSSDRSNNNEAAEETNPERERQDNPAQNSPSGQESRESNNSQQEQPSPSPAQNQGQSDRREGSPQSESERAQNGGQRSPGNGNAAGENRGPLGGNWDQRLNAPITGDDFREWSDQLRDVEEIVDDPKLRAEAARIREKARGFRSEFKRHSEEPKWELIRDLVSRPLRELRQNVATELMRVAAEKNAIVPIDKDPVPKQYSEQVRRYYENLGTGE